MTRNEDMRQRGTKTTERKERSGLYKGALKRYKRNKAELASIDCSLEKLREQLEGVRVVSGKVQKSSDDFPYIREHVPVKVLDPKLADPIRVRIQKKEQRRAELVKEIDLAEDFISEMPAGLDKDIFEMVYLNGVSQEQVGEAIGYTQSMISKIISGHLKDS